MTSSINIIFCSSLFCLLMFTDSADSLNNFSSVSDRSAASFSSFILLSYLYLSLWIIANLSCTIFNDSSSSSKCGSSASGWIARTYSSCFACTFSHKNLQFLKLGVNHIGFLLFNNTSFKRLYTLVNLLLDIVLAFFSTSAAISVIAGVRNVSGLKN